MLIFYILILAHFYLVNSIHHVSNNMRKKLDAEAENSVCCANNLPCCMSTPKLIDFEIKSVITECPNLKCTNWSITHKIVETNKPLQEKLTECKQKLLLTIKMMNQGLPSDKSEYVIIDHITESTNMKKVRILNPYAVRIRQDPVLQVYGLTFERAVNGEARERVLNKNNREYRGCNTDYENPTCGVVQHQGKVVPYSTGFCCSCNADKNRAMEEHANRVQWPFDASIPAYNKNPEENNYKHHGFTEHDGTMVYGRSQKRADKSVNYDQFTELKDGKVRQRRGGQSCDDIDVGSLPESFHESTHCLTFSNLWYSVYQITKPQLVHRLKIQIYQKYEDCNGNTHWMDLTQGKAVEIGTHLPNYIEKDFIAKYTCNDIPDSDLCLDYRKFKLLVPEKRIADPEQFMMLPNRLVSDGKTCDTAGVGYEAFYKQKKRCSASQGTCLQNQPQQLMQNDLEAQKEGKSGNYFLKFFGTLADNPVGYNSTGQIQYLKMVYTKPYFSTLYFELNADLVTVLKPNAFATITEIYTDATNPAKSRLIIKVTNSGLLYGVFYVRLSGCPLDVPATFNNIASKSVLIPPQHQHIFNLYIEYLLPVKEICCSIHVHNINQELIAVRPIRIRSYDRCICIWHCECACLIGDSGLKCTTMNIEAYHAAGFQGGLSTPSKLIESSYLDEIFAMLFSMFIFLILTLLAMGLVKALLGMCSTEIGIWGLDIILGVEKPSVICTNKDCEFRQDLGVSGASQFCLNLLFFFLYPVALFNVCLKKYCFSNYTREDEGCSCQEDWLDYECNDEICPVRSTKSSVPTENASAFSMKYTTSEEKSMVDSKQD